LRRLVSLTFACGFSVLSSFAYAQQLDVAVGGSTLLSSKSGTASLAYLPPAEKGGVYPSASLQYIFKNHLGFNAEGTFRYKQGLYNGFQRFRPVLYDANAVYAHRLTDNASGDLMAGVGAETLIFYTQFNSCNNPAGCNTYVNSNHFLVHIGGDLRYYAWRSFFVRPEAHYYFVKNNFEFHSNNILRLGVSIGYTFGPH
jgi:hypothetical protein